jgi:heptosyltransferase-2
MTGTTPPIERLVIRAPNWLGDAVLALPAMAAVRAHLPDSEITVAAPAGIASLFREQTIARADRVMDLPDKHSEVTVALRNGGFDACLLFPNSFRAAWQARRARIAHRWGYGTANRRWLLTRVSRKPARAEARHQGRLLLRACSRARRSLRTGRQSRPPARAADAGECWARGRVAATARLGGW